MMTLEGKARVVIVLVSECYDVPVEDILSIQKTARVFRPRHVAMYLCRNDVLMSFPAIGRLFVRDNSTVQNGCGQIRRALKKEPKLVGVIAALRSRYAECMQEGALAVA